MTQVRAKGAEIIARARAEHRHIIVLAGRPYHVDPEVNHGIDKLIIRQGAAVVTEDSVSCYEEKFDTAVLNQPPVCGRQVLHHPAGYGPGAAGILRLRPGCHYHR